MGEKKWYVLRTAGGKEKKAKEYLEKEIERSGLTNQVSNVLVPVEKKYTIKNGKRVCTEKVLYPTYVYIEAVLSPDLEYIVRNLIPGMSGFLTERADEKIGARIPVHIRQEEINVILGVQDEESSKVATAEIEFNVGDSVKINEGPFSGFSGTVDEIVEDRSKIKVIVVIFGRKTILELSFTQVTKE